MVNAQFGPVQPCAAAHNFNTRELRRCGALQTLKVLARNGYSYAVRQAQANAVSSTVIRCLDGPPVISFELFCTMERSVNLRVRS